MKALLIIPCGFRYQEFIFFHNVIRSLLLFLNVLISFGIHFFSNSAFSLLDLYCNVQYFFSPTLGLGLIFSLSNTLTQKLGDQINFSLFFNMYIQCYKFSFKLSLPLKYFCELCSHLIYFKVFLISFFSRFLR